MKKIQYSFVFLLFFLLHQMQANVVYDAKNEPNEIVAEMTTAIRRVQKEHHSKNEQLSRQLTALNNQLAAESNRDRKLDFLIQKDEIKEQMRLLQLETNSEISKIRYLKGLQVIKTLYEKVLSLDHHFASVRTLNEINKISNPNQYPEYSKLKEVVNAKKDKKTSLDLTSVLGTNTIVSVVQTFTNMIASSLTKEEKEKELANVDCILDFTLRMQNDLNTIYFETAFLQTSNEKIKQEIELLFKDYTKPIGYVATLENCRTNDDWETITQKMEEYLTKMKTTTGTSQYKMQVNMEFPIDRLLQFINQYNNFIDQGGKFYEKFKIILNSYENAKQCETKLPLEYKKLKADIDVAINKFNVAYKPVEVNGTKMKEILYGLNEFD
ncbi:hypothetical protein FCR2A7T_19400 [Flavobacterium cauense R2A-7]|uniref:Uncharacterized protein n=1 Tax=Flavobacterium cauense R2A-7 TaxID=1341154 RepID=V6RYT4_9FLAO|nr:hypothetical protein [Flavobacterium cauense]ESU19329.1 hypothetical protein FCR2A7T_19400 [Flavobacterium cauense R2A-7]KGO80295.1 hypothetical protein Q762_11700 [Flavobacterium cauense R2A-7]TWI09297.1 hypothetical protein IP98_02458 [Flavobacterium cauense R2A-7]